MEELVARTAGRTFGQYKDAAAIGAHNLTFITDFQIYIRMAVSAPAAITADRGGFGDNRLFYFGAVHYIRSTCCYYILLPWLILTTSSANDTPQSNIDPALASFGNHQ